MSDDDTIIARRQQQSVVHALPRNALSLIEYHEGRRLGPYKDSLGHWSTGVGHLLLKTDPQWMWQPITNEQCDEIRDKDVALHTTYCQEYLWYKGLSEERAAAVLDMMFNLGPSKFSAFRHFIAAMQHSDWPTAHGHLLDSDAARELPKRYGELANLILDETWPV